MKEIDNKSSKKAKWITIIGVILFLLTLATIYPQWNEIWYEFGRNLYIFFNG